MSADSSRRQPLATWNPVRGVWEVPGTESLLCEHLEVFSETWPTSGMTRNGSAFALPTQAPPMAGSGSSLLPTPKASDGPNGGPGMRNGRGEADALPGVVSLLPTPRAQNGEDRNSLIWERPADQPQNLENAMALLPTPTTWDPEESPDDYARRRLDKRAANPNLGDLHFKLGMAVQTLPPPRPDFGPYAPAIARWEAILGRPAPSPTEPGKGGRPRLSPRFVEWMMGLPAGHCTAPTIGLSRAQQLKALGNGVVPQQAAMALRLLLGLPTAAPTAAPTADLLPTPACNDMGEGKTVDGWDEWTARMKSAHANGNGHGKSLAIEALRLGEHT